MKRVAVGGVLLALLGGSLAANASPGNGNDCPPGYIRVRVDDTGDPAVDFECIRIGGDDDDGGTGGTGGTGGNGNEPFTPNFDSNYGASYLPVNADGQPAGAVDPDTQPSTEVDPDVLDLGDAPNIPVPTTPVKTVKGAPVAKSGASADATAARVAKTVTPVADVVRAVAPEGAAEVAVDGDAVGSEDAAVPTPGPIVPTEAPAIDTAAVPGNGVVFEDAMAEPAITIAPPAEIVAAKPVVTDRVAIDDEYVAAITGDVDESIQQRSAVDRGSLTGEVLTVTTLGGLLAADLPDWARQEIAATVELDFPVLSLDPADYTAEQLATTLLDPIQFNRDAMNMVDATLNGGSSREGQIESRGGGCNGDWNPGAIEKSKSLNWNKQYKFDKSGKVGELHWAMKAYIYGAVNGTLGAKVDYETKKCFGIPYAIRFVKATLNATANGHLQAFLQAKAQIEYQDDFSYTLPYQFGGGFSVLGFKFEASAQADVTAGAKISAAVDAELKMRLDAIGIVDYSWECPRGQGCQPVKKNWTGNVTKSDDTGARLNIDLGIAPYLSIGLQAEVAIIAPILSGRVAVVIAAPVNLHAAACLYDVDDDNNFDGSFGLFIDVSLDLYGYYYYQAFGLKGWGTFPIGGPSTNPTDVSGGWRRVTTDADSSSMYHIWPGHNSPMVQGVKLTKTTKVLFSRPLLNASPGVLRPIVRQKTGGITIKPQTCYPFNSGKPKYQIDFDGLNGPRPAETTLYDAGTIPFPAGATPTAPGKVAVRIIGDDMGRNFNTTRHPSRWVEIKVIDPAMLPPDTPGQIEPDLQITKNAKPMNVAVNLEGTPGQPASLKATVTVKTPDGKPIKGATVNGTWKKATGSGFTTTNSNGVAELTAQSYPLFNPSNEATTFTVDAVEADGFGKLSGNLTATWVDITRWNAGTIPGQSLVSTVLKKAGVPMVVALGDSYISGEGGRWAGNATTFLWWNNTDRGSSAYQDSIPFCHQSKSALIHYQLSRQFSMNLACSGATTNSAKFDDIDGTPLTKPGVDFGNTGAPGVTGQLTTLKELTSRYEIGAIHLSIGGNDFGFGDMVKECVVFDNSCRDGSVASATIGRAETVKNSLVTSIKGIKTAMAGQSSAYKIIVNNYPRPIPSGDKLRWAPTASDRQLLYGCGFSKDDATWATSTLIGKINDTVAEAVNEARATVPNVYLLDISDAFKGHELCNNSAYLVGEVKMGHGWVKGSDRDLVEWVTQVRLATTASDRFMIQEGLHPNYWGQLALRNCARQMSNLVRTVPSTPTTMHCRPGGLDVLDTAVGKEPKMSVTPL